MEKKRNGKKQIEISNGNDFQLSIHINDDEVNNQMRMEKNKFFLFKKMLICLPIQQIVSFVFYVCQKCVYPTTRIPTLYTYLDTPTSHLKQSCKQKHDNNNDDDDTMKLSLNEIMKIIVADTAICC